MYPNLAPQAFWQSKKLGNDYTSTGFAQEGTILLRILVQKCKHRTNNKTKHDLARPLLEKYPEFLRTLFEKYPEMLWTNYRVSFGGGG